MPESILRYTFLRPQSKGQIYHTCVSITFHHDHVWAFCPRCQREYQAQTLHPPQISSSVSQTQATTVICHPHAHHFSKLKAQLLCPRAKPMHTPGRAWNSTPSADGSGSLSHHGGAGSPNSELSCYQWALTLGERRGDRARQINVHSFHPSMDYWKVPPCSFSEESKWSIDIALEPHILSQ